MNETPACKVRFYNAMQSVVERTEGLLARVAARPLKQSRAQVRMVALFGRAMAFRVAGAAPMRATGWEFRAAPEIDGVRYVVIALANAILANQKKGTVA